MDKNILAVLELRFERAQRKAQEHAMEGFSATNSHEKCRNEIEMAYNAGKAEAYAEAITLLTEGTAAVVELKELVEKAAEEVLQFHRLEMITGAVHGFEVKDSFEDGIEALKRRLLSIIDPKSFEVRVIENKAGEQADGF